MCVGSPGRIIWIGEPQAGSTPARAQFVDAEQMVDLVLVPDAGEGDWVVVHAGYAIRVIGKQQAKEILEALRTAGR